MIKTYFLSQMLQANGRSPVCTRICTANCHFRVNASWNRKICISQQIGMVFLSTYLLNRFRKRSGALDRGCADEFLVDWTVRKICYIAHICTDVPRNVYVDERSECCECRTKPGIRNIGRVFRLCVGASAYSDIHDRQMIYYNTGK